MREISNAKIKNTKFDTDRGLTHYITVEGDGWGCSLGGYYLGGEACAIWIEQFMKVMEIWSYSESDVVGKIVRVKMDGNMIAAIGHPYKDIWLEPKVLFAKFDK